MSIYVMYLRNDINYKLFMKIRDHEKETIKLLLNKNNDNTWRYIVWFKCLPFFEQYII